MVWNFHGLFVGGIYHQLLSLRWLLRVSASMAGKNAQRYMAAKSMILVAKDVHAILGGDL